ncbi:MAG: hypothetical protein R2788_20490 [Saprospiraceae bacterium]
MKNKKYELSIWGASGFTGQLVAEYLLQQYGDWQRLKMGHYWPEQK